MSSSFYSLSLADSSFELSISIALYDIIFPMIDVIYS